MYDINYPCVSEGVRKRLGRRYDKRLAQKSERERARSRGKGSDESNSEVICAWLQRQRFRRLLSPKP
eukprot:6191867-Pleurochrysis_carterae.AAC.3